MAITAAQVKELRDSTGAGMMDAKRALEETGGEIEAAVDWLRTKGLAKAAKKAGRTAAEGLVAVAVKDGVGVAVEVNSETDFVAKNADFQAMVGKIAETALGTGSVEELAQAGLDGKTVAETVTAAVVRIGENLTLRRMGRVTGDSVAAYIHTAAAEGMGRIGVLVALKGGAADAATGIGKPEAVIEKMIEGRMRKFFAEVTLLGQQFVVNPDLTVAQAAKDAGVEVTGFVRMAVGEGIEKETEDYAAEVAKLAKG